MSDPATIDSIEDALFLALQGVSIDGGGPFAFVGRFAGEPTQDALAEAALQTPAALLALESDDPIETTAVATLTSGLVAQDARSVWRVYVVVSDGRDDAEAAKSPPGTLDLVKSVKGAITGLEIEGLADHDVVWYSGTKPARIQRGVIYAYMVRFSADYPSDVIDPEVDGVPLESVQADINLVPPAGGGDSYDANPIAKLETDF